MKILQTKATIFALILAALSASVNANEITLAQVGGVADVENGNSFQIDLLGTFPIGLFGGSVAVGWDATKVSLDAITLNPAIELVPPFGTTGWDDELSCPGAAGCPPPGVDSATLLWAGGGSFVVANVTDELMATLDFTAIGPGPALFTTGEDLLAGDPTGWFDATFEPFTPTYGSTEVNITGVVIPVPAAVWLFGSGLLGLVGVARRRKAA